MSILVSQEEASTSPRLTEQDAVDPFGSERLVASSLLRGDFNFDVSDWQHAIIDGLSRPALNDRAA